MKNARVVLLLAGGAALAHAAYRNGLKTGTQFDTPPVSLRIRIEIERPSVSETDDDDDQAGAAWPDRLESELTSAGAVLAFAAVVVAMLVGAVFYILNAKERREVYDYLSYTLPCVAAITAGLTTYFDKYRGVLFAASLTWLVLGLEMYAAAHSEHVRAIGWLSLALLVPVNLASLYLRWRYMQNNKHERGCGAWQLIGKMVGGYALPIVMALVTLYGTLFFAHNYGCVGDTLERGECHSLWLWWSAKS